MSLKSGLLLIFLLPNWTHGVDSTLNIQTLGRIINFFERNYKRLNNGQYATAINVPMTQCQEGFIPSRNNFLTHENANAVNDYFDRLTPVYQGREIIAAGTIRNGKYNIHSEFLLLHPPGNSLMSNLLSKNNQDCSIFYTFNSPCLGTCLDEEGPYNILDALDNWSRRPGVKAFVFKQFWKHDRRNDLQRKLTLITSRVPLYRCVNENECYACKGEPNTPIDEHCLPPHRDQEL